MIDLRLVFSDEASGLAVLLAAGVEAEAAGITSGDFGVCVTGLRIESAPAVLDEAGEVVTPPMFAAGWHVDLRLRHTDTAPEELAAFVVHPSAPQHDWAGGM